MDRFAWKWLRNQFDAKLYPAMTYQEFNLKILEFYLVRSTSTYCNLAIDAMELQSIVSPATLGDFDILKNDWGGLINTQQEPPQYFGIIAIQCYAASLMQAEGQYSASAYQIRLREILGIDSDNELQQLFRGCDKFNPIQEEMWHMAKHYLKAEHNLKLEIPNKTVNAGRFVQYPKSQALLNTEDLKRFTVFFNQEFKIKEMIAFDFFKDKLDAWLNANRLSWRISSLFSDFNKYEQCCKQVYNYYNSWNGDVCDETVKSRVRQSTTNTLRSSLLLLFRDGNPQFYTTSESESKLIKTDEVFSLASHKYFYKGIIIFRELEYYPEEYEEARFLIFGYSSYILVNRISNEHYNEALEKLNGEKTEITKNLLLYKVQVDKSFFESSLGAFVTAEHPISLLNGLKVNRKNEYLKGFGPQIISENKFSVFIGNKKCNYDPATAGTGLYQVRTENYPDTKFLIVENSDNAHLISSTLSGWNLNKMNIEEEYHVEGCYFKNILLSDTNKAGRSWIRMNVGLATTYWGKNILLNALKNALK